MYLFDYLQSSPLSFCLVMGLLGLLVGSFLNVVILRLPGMMHAQWDRECREHMGIDDKGTDDTVKINLIRPGSHCPRCGHRITVLENIPVLSYIFLRGRCSECKQPISIRYPVIELLSAISALFIAWHFGYGIQALMAAFLTWTLIALTMIDIDHQLLPDDITLPLLWLGLLVNMFGIFTDIQSSLIGAMAGYGILWSVYQLFKLLTGKEGMGYGDFKLLAVLGAWLGWQMLPLIIVLSSISGAVVGIGLILLRSHDKSIPIPFGPFLALAGWLSLIWGTGLMETYNKWAFGI